MGMDPVHTVLDRVAMVLQGQPLAEKLFPLNFMPTFTVLRVKEADLRL